uniref:Uncharacterized protein n=1 Tax=Avena sativa TaxID=4498 RepID=A0ACD5TGB2_AVESA
MTMAVEAKHETLCIKRILRCSIRISYRSASEHWALFSLVLLLYLLQRSSPGLFAFILSSSPVIICATLLLGILLSYGSTHLPQTGEDRKPVPGFSAPGFGCCSRDTNFEARQRFSVPAFEENTVSFKCWEIRKPSFGKERDDKLVELDDAVPLLKGSVDQGDDRVDANDTLAEVVASIPSMVTLHRKIGMEEVMKANHEMESKVPFSSNDKSTEHANLFEDVDQSGRQFSGKSVSKLSVVSESDTLSSAADQEELNDLVKKDFQRWFSDKSMSKLSIVSESDTLSLVGDQEEHNDFVMKDIQRWFSDKSMSKLSIVSESDALSLVADQEEHGDLINKEFLWHFHRQFSDKSVSKRTESGTISVVADQEEHSDFNKDFLWYFQRQFSDMSVSKLSTAAESDIISSVVADADQEDHDDPMKKDFLLEHASSELLRQETDFDILEERSDLINLVDGETLSAVTSGVESEPVEDTAT